MPKTTVLISLVSALLATLSVSAHAAPESTRAVIKAIEARDCAGAVRELNTALATASPEALMLGGAMFEQGLCLKPNLERAARLYTKAAEAGAPSARSRLAALYASPAAGPDRGAAMWWAMQVNLPLPAACLVDTESRTDADKFAKALGAWPASQLDACVHVTGVMALLDAEFVSKPASEGGAMAVDFRPATSGFEVKVSAASVALIDNSPRIGTSSNSGNLVANNNVTQSATPEQMLALRAQEDRQALLQRIEAVGKDALTRYPRPAGIPADWRIQWSIAAARDR